MKIIFIGDIHGRASWKDILSTQEWDKAVFIGDYFDSFEFNAIEQLKNFDEICLMKRSLQAAEGKEVIMLIGNHDHHYFRAIGDAGTSGYQARAAKNIEFALEDNKDLLQMAFMFDNILCTHAGVGEAWLESQGWKGENIADFINDIWKHRPGNFTFHGRDPYGDDMGQTPIWIRPKSLMRDSQALKRVGIIQVVGHTGMKSIDIEGKSTGGKYFFIDTLGKSGEYLIYEDEKFKIGKI